MATSHPTCAVTVTADQRRWIFDAIALELSDNQSLDRDFVQRPHDFADERRKLEAIFAFADRLGHGKPEQPAYRVACTARMADLITKWDRDIAEHADYEHGQVALAERDHSNYQTFAGESRQVVLERCHRYARLSLREHSAMRDLALQLQTQTCGKP